MTRLYIDMDGVLCNFEKAFNEKRIADKIEYPQCQARFFENLEPIEDAIVCVNMLRMWYDVWILSAPSVLNPYCYTEKRIWIEEHFDLELCDNLELTRDKSGRSGYLVDDNIQNGFNGEFIHFGSEEFPDWATVTSHLFTENLNKNKL